MSFYYKPAEAALIRSQNERARMDIKAINCYRSFGDGTSTTTPFLYTNEQIQELSRQLQEEEQRKRRAAQWHRRYGLPHPWNRPGQVITLLDEQGYPTDEGQAVAAGEYVRRYHLYRDRAACRNPHFKIFECNDATFLYDADTIRKIAGWHPGARHRFLRWLGFKPRPCGRFWR